MVVYTCKKCGEQNFLTPHAFWNITDFGTKCEKCVSIIPEVELIRRKQEPKGTFKKLQERGIKITNYQERGWRKQNQE